MCSTINPEYLLPPSQEEIIEKTGLSVQELELLKHTKNPHDIIDIVIKFHSNYDKFDFMEDSEFCFDKICETKKDYFKRRLNEYYTKGDNIMLSLPKILYTVIKCIKDYSKNYNTQYKEYLTEFRKEQERERIEYKNFIDDLNKLKNGNPLNINYRSIFHIETIYRIERQCEIVNFFDTNYMRNLLGVKKRVINYKKAPKNYFMLPCKKDETRNKSLDEVLKINKYGFFDYEMNKYKFVMAYHTSYKKSNGKYDYYYKFRAFNSHLDFLKYLDEIYKLQFEYPKDKLWLLNHTFQEVINGNLPQKIRFDIDIESKLEYDTLKSVDLENISNIIINMLIKHINLFFIDDLVEYDYRMDIEDCLLFETKHENKASFHLIVNDFYHNNHHEAMAFYNLIIDHIINDDILNHENIYRYKNTIITNIRKFVDSNIYKSRSNFRILNSSKATHWTHYKKFNPEIKVIPYILPYPDEYIISNIYKYDNTRTYQLYEASFISVVNNRSNILPRMSENPKLYKYVNRKHKLQEIPNIKFTNDIKCKAMDLLVDRYNSHIFEFEGEIKNNMMILKKKHPYECNICKRCHDGHQNGKLILIDKKTVKKLGKNKLVIMEKQLYDVYFNCFQSDKNEFLGSI